jgi:hypothetical protein
MPESTTQRTAERDTELSLARSPEMKIGSLLRGGLPSFYSTEVLLPLIILGKGLPQTAKERGQLLS